MPRRRAILAAAAAALAAPAIARAQEGWPERPVRIIVPFPPGQAADIITRHVADQLSRRWPQRVVVENRAGGAGAPAMQAGATAPPDGYTLTAGTSGTLGINPSVLVRPPYDAERDFAAITNIAMVPLLIIAHPSFPGNTVQDLVRLARERPGALDMASAGPATSQHLSAELFQHLLGIRLNIVHYRGSGPAITDLVAGNVPLMFDSVTSALGHLREGRAKALAVGTPQRIPWLPEVPTIAETVLPGYEAFGWTGLVAPAATPKEIIRRINADVTAILREPEMIQRIQQLGALPDPRTPEEFAAFIRAEIAKWGEVVRRANVTLN
ncbi:Bug family tripartite tricarboxylate transporter substrate binding protein [Crenalkalicoccus roseus]|uniref:Bug family tripartite tricarboxylate transporter substrate binding protein n=1 Tax=Crenalkalicoccus roseus TaxID=1485588 RepID=UPI001080E44C|nr:tripartite tricarboxylate transporter substrate binding protein [Crenalkalicoccus roseus]